jgi:hypothetical protein
MCLWYDLSTHLGVVTLASHQGQADVPKKVIDSHCNIDLQELSGYTPLHVTVHQGYPVEVEG